MMRMCQTQVPISTYHVSNAAYSDDIKTLTSAVIATVAVVVTVCIANNFYLNDATKLTTGLDNIYKSYVITPCTFVHYHGC